MFELGEVRNGQSRVLSVTGGPVLLIVFAIVGCAIELIFIRHLCCITRWRGRLLTTGYPPCFRPVVVGGPGRVVWGSPAPWRAGTCRVGLRRRGGRRRRRGPGAARSRPCGAARRSCAGAGPLPRAGAQFPVDCFLLLGGVAGAGAGRRRMPPSRWRPDLGGRPRRRPSRRRTSPVPFFLADCDWLSVGWVFWMT